MKKRLFWYSILITFLGLVAFFAAGVFITHNNNRSIAKDAVMEITQICAGLYHEDIDLASFVRVGSDARITVISPDGMVLADSRPLDMGRAASHLSRPEIIAAYEGSPAAFIRYSDTLGLDLIYYALKVDSGSDYVFIRAAIPVAEINAYLFRSLPLLVLILFAVALLCLVFIRGMANRITRPFLAIGQKLRMLSGGQYALEPIIASYEEIDSITKEIDDVSLVLQNSFDSLRSEKNKIDYILNNISDSIFAVDENGCIVLINNAATKVFGVTAEIINKNMNYLTSEKLLLRAAFDCVNKGNSTILEVNIYGKIFLVTIKRLPDTALTMVVLSDVTQNRENAKRREEFFANASHELKTPLTAIKGFNELTAINNKDVNIGKYISSITRETDRMLSLIADMLKLSELENAQVIVPVPVSLAEVVNEVQIAMITVIDEKAVSFEVEGDAVVTADYSHIYDLVKNLIENAVRYNNVGGEVKVVINKDGDAAWLSVSDNGIGISAEEQTRIFERFYRVEKSRSQRNGGTGLGLSIVKHICALYGFRLSLKSKPGVGTEIVVSFNE